MSDYNSGNKTYVILILFLVFIVGIAVVFRFMKYKKENPDVEKTTTTESLTTTTTKEISKVITIGKLDTFLSYTSNRSDVNKISLKDKTFEEIEIPDIATYCETGEEYKDTKGNTITFKCEQDNTSARVTVNKVVGFNTILNKSVTTKASVYTNGEFYIIYNTPATGYIGDIVIYNNKGSILLSDLIINHTGLSNKAAAVPFIQDNVVYYISSEADEVHGGYNCGIDYIDFNNNGKSGTFTRYSCNP